MLKRVLAPLSLVALVTANLLAGCASETEEQEEGGAAATVRSIENAKVVEQSRFRHEGQLSGTNDGQAVSSYRVNGFGATKVRVTVKAKNGSFAPLVAIAGPVPGDETKIVTSKRGTTTGGVVLETTLAARGAYRILVGTEASFGGRRGDAGAFDVSFSCLSHCDLPEIPLADVVNELKTAVGPDRLRETFAQLVGSRVEASDARATLLRSIEDLLENPEAIDRQGLPVVPLSFGATAQSFIAGQTGTAAGPAAAQRIDLGRVECTAHRPDPSAATELLPGLSAVSFPDFTYDDCSLAKLEALAESFNALSMQNGSEVTNGGARFTAVSELTRALIESGHRIVIDNARYNADFLGLAYKNATVRASVWVDTGIPLQGGGTLRMPAPHAHHNIWISGPQFDGQLKFYMGVDNGTAFRAPGSIMNGWAGGRVAYTIDSATKADDVVRILGVAGDLRKKWQTASATLPMQGYGQLGVCTDSTAILEHAYRGSVSLFPLAHPVAEANANANADAIDRILSALPTDLASSGVGADAVRRIAESIPFDDVSDVPFPAFRDSWAKVQR